jgi:hypothetical protein
MRRNPGTVVVLAGPAPAQVLAAVDRSMNVTLVRPEDPGEAGSGDALEVAARALQRAGRVPSPYALVPADPLAAVAASWRDMWDVSSPQGPAEFEADAARALAAWRSGQFELPDYYLVLAAAEPSAPAGPGGPRPGGPRPGSPRSGGPRPGSPRSGGPRPGSSASAAADGSPRPDFHLGPLRSVRPHRVAVVAAAEPAQQAAGVLHELGSLRHGPWWPGLDELIEVARRFYPDSLAGGPATLASAITP